MDEDRDDLIGKSPLLFFFYVNELHLMLLYLVYIVDYNDVVTFIERSKISANSEELAKNNSIFWEVIDQHKVFPQSLIFSDSFSLFNSPHVLLYDRMDLLGNVTFVSSVLLSYCKRISLEFRI
jgi:hypothetical protein